jgi:predicted O-linked N-acetylglucosamine transferase (SPINDLY family)
VQASWLGFFATTGCRAIDYFIGDAHTLPPTRSITSPSGRGGCRTATCASRRLRTTSRSAAPMATNGGVTFGCFGKLVKISDGVVALRSRILHAPPGAPAAEGV